MGARKLVLLRHGRTAWNAQRRFQGQADPPLDDVGRAQAYEVADLVAALHPALLVSSDAARAMQTAQIVAAACALDVRPEPRLRERALGHWEGLTRDEVAERYPSEFAEWLAGKDVNERGGEARPVVAERAMAAVHDLPDVPLTVLVTHSATAMALINSLLGIPQDLRPLGPLANCHWSEVYLETHEGAEGVPAQWRLRGHNLGAPGTVVPLPFRPEVDAAEITDADA